MAQRYDVSGTQMESLGIVTGDMGASPISSFEFSAMSSGGFSSPQPTVSTSFAPGR